MIYIRKNKYLIALCFIIFILFNIQFFSFPKESVWDEAYFLGESIQNSKHLESGQFTKILSDEHKGTILPTLGMMIYFITGSEVIMHYFSTLFFLVLLCIYLWRILRLYYDETKSFFLTFFIISLPQILTLYPLYMRDIPFGAVSVMMIYYCLTVLDTQKWKNVSISILLTFLIRPIFSVIYFLIPFVITYFKKIKYKKSFFCILGFIVLALIAKIMFIYCRSFLQISLAETYLYLFQMTMVVGAILLIIKVIRNSENKIILHVFYYPIIIFFVYINLKLDNLFWFIYKATFSQFAKSIGVFNKELNNLDVKIIDLITSYNFPLFVFLSIVLFKKKNLNNLIKLNLIYFVLAWIFFNFFQPAIDQRLTSGLYIIGFLFLFILLHKEIIAFSKFKSITSILILISFMLLPLQRKIIFRTEFSSGPIDEFVSKINDNLTENINYISIISYNELLLDTYRLRYKAIKDGKDIFFLNGNAPIKHLDTKPEINKVAFDFLPNIEKIFVVGPFNGLNYELNQKNKVINMEDQLIKKIESVLLESLPRQNKLVFIDKFFVKDLGEFHIYHRNKIESQD